MRVVCGEFWGKRGPVDGVAADPRYLDVSVPPGKRKTLPVETERHAFAYVFAGSGTFPRRLAAARRADREGRSTATRSLVREQTGNRSLVLFDSGDEVTVQAGDEGIRFLLVSGKPIEEPVAWYGPIVMNTQAELQQAVAELRSGQLHQVAGCFAAERGGITPAAPAARAGACRAADRSRGPRAERTPPSIAATTSAETGSNMP